jgi:catechol 2,3-dioxygenase-like lactoylglutathione lyase family enzyme
MAGILDSAEPMATVPVKDLGKALEFYSNVLGLKPIDGDGKEVMVYQGAGGKVVVYHSDFAGSNQATTATWRVRELEDVVDKLKSRGVRFERYDMPGLERNGDIHAAGDMKVAWFKDPEGNIHNLVTG